VNLNYSIDVTEEVQDTLSSYHRMFGTKNIDFNYDSSVFKKIEQIIKGGKKMIDIINKKEQKEGVAPGSKTLKYRLVLFCQVSGERFMFEVPYDESGNLVRKSDFVEKDDLVDYLKRNVHKLYVQGRASGVAKSEFMENSQSIPFLHDLVRVETFYRDRTNNTFARKEKLSEEVIVLLNVGTLQLIFKFQNKLMHNVEGEFEQIKVGDEDKIILNGKAVINAFKVLMMVVFREDVISDLR